MFKIALIQTVQIEKTGRPEIGLGIAFLKSFILKNEPNVSIELFINNEESYEQFNPLQYDMVGISSVSFCFDEAIDIARKIKGANTKIAVLVGGSHITGLPRSIECKYFDVGVIGEGEETFLELIRAFKKHKKFKTDVLKNIKGICFYRNGSVHFTGYREYIQPIDLIPNFDKSFLKKYGGLPYLISSRGCPFNCKYCSSYAAWKNKVRFHSPEYIIRDILEIKELFKDDDRIILKDDNFTMNTSLLRGLEEKKERIEQISGRKTYFVGSSHVRFINHKLLKTLKYINTKKINFGIESGSERILKIVKRGSASVKESQVALDLCYEYGIKAASSFLIGIPEETEDDLKKTYEFILKNLRSKRLLTTGTLVLTPLPDDYSDYWKIAVKKYNIDINNFQWKRLDFRTLHHYYHHHGGTSNINDWWAWRKRNRKLYIGGLDEDKFLKLIEPYEKEIIKYNEINIKIDRTMYS